MENYKKLRRRARRFVEAIVEGYTGAESIRRAGFTGTRPNIAASKLRAKPHVRAAIEEFEATMAEEVRRRIYGNLRGLELIASFDPRRLQDENGLFLPLEEWPDEVAAAIQSVEIEELFEGRDKNRRHIGRVKKYRTASKIEARKLLMQYQRVLVEKHEHSGPDGGPIPTQALPVDPKDALETYLDFVGRKPEVSAG